MALPDIETWQDVLDVTKKLYISQFKYLSSNDERVHFCTADSLISRRVEEWFSIVSSSRHRKHWEKAAELRSDGNIYFSNARYDLAAERYSLSILAAPHPAKATGVNAGHCEELSLSFANRSAAFFYLGEYHLSIKDVQNAFLHGYPTELSYKLHIRQGQCYLKLVDYESALESFRQAEESLQFSKLSYDKLAKQRQDVAALIVKCVKGSKLASKVAVDPDDYKNEDPMADILSGFMPNGELRGASDSVEMLYSTAKGRFVVAKCEAKAGEVLFVEEPYASVLLPSCLNTHCQHCYREIKACYPCANCSQVRYCSPSCSDDAWNSYHRFECGALDLLHSVGIAHLAVRILLLTGCGCLQDGSWKERPYKAVYDLLTHEKDMCVDDLFQYAMTASLLLKFLECSGFFSMCDSSDYKGLTYDTNGGSGRNSPFGNTHRRLRSLVVADSAPHDQLKVFIGGLLLRHIEQLVCNAHAITSLEPSVTEDDGVVFTQEQVRVATAIYPGSSMMNHSCKPNIICSFRRGKTLVVRAMENLKQGDEVFNCYGPHYCRMSFVERQRALREQYMFECGCEACQRGDADDHLPLAFSCEKCSGPLSPIESSGKATCMECDLVQDCLERQQRAFRVDDLFIQGAQIMEKGNFEEACQKLQKCLSVREKLLYKHNRRLLETYDLVARCLCGLKEYKRAADVLKKAVHSISEIYGSNSIELGNELMKLCDVLVNACLEGRSRLGGAVALAALLIETRRSLIEAAPIFELHYGSHCDPCQEIADKLKLVDELATTTRCDDDDGDLNGDGTTTTSSSTVLVDS